MVVQCPASEHSAAQILFWYFQKDLKYLILQLEVHNWRRFERATWPHVAHWLTCSSTLWELAGGEGYLDGPTGRGIAAVALKRDARPSPGLQEKVVKRVPKLGQFNHSAERNFFVFS